MTSKNHTIPLPKAGRIDADSIVDSFAFRMMYSVANDHYTAPDFDAYQALAYAVRDRLMERWFQTQDAYYRAGCEAGLLPLARVPPGPASCQQRPEPRRAGRIRARRSQAGLRRSRTSPGAGVGRRPGQRRPRPPRRLLSRFGRHPRRCPFYGYGIRYEYGIFRQRIIDGQQIETPDNWLRYGNPWEVPRPRRPLPRPHSTGAPSTYVDDEGRNRVRWVDTQNVYAMAYDTLAVRAIRNDNVNTLRLWAAKSSREFDLAAASTRRLRAGGRGQERSPRTSPRCSTRPTTSSAGQELRLKQQYFFVSATLQDVLRRFRKQPRRLGGAARRGRHPAQRHASRPGHPRADAAARRSRAAATGTRPGPSPQRVFAYTNHTDPARGAGVLAGWSCCAACCRATSRSSRRSTAASACAVRRAPSRMTRTRGGTHGHHRQDSRPRPHGPPGHRRQPLGQRRGPAPHRHPHASGSFADFDAALSRAASTTRPTASRPRRWLLQVQPGLARLITDAIGDGWVTRSRPAARARSRSPDDPAYRAQLVGREVRRRKAAWRSGSAADQGHVDSTPTSLFDCQVKRIHEYKRQLLNVLHVIALYQRIREGRGDGVPRTVIFAGKAAPATPWPS